MKTLREHPEHMQRVENDYLFRSEIYDIVGEIMDNPDDYTQEEYNNKIIKCVSEFVNQNYAFKKDEAKSFDEGYEQGKVDYEEENPPVNKEKLCTEYVVEKFEECETISEFKSVFNELRNLSYTYMQ